MIVTPMTLTQYYDLIVERATFGKYKWVIMLIGRKAEALNIYNEIEKTWASLNDLTNDRIAFIFSMSVKVVGNAFYRDPKKESYVGRMCPFATIVGPDPFQDLDGNFNLYCHDFDKYDWKELHTQSTTEFIRKNNIKEEELPGLFVYNVLTKENKFFHLRDEKCVYEYMKKFVISATQIDTEIEKLELEVANYMKLCNLEKEILKYASEQSLSCEIAIKEVLNEERDYKSCKDLISDKQIRNKIKKYGQWKRQLKLNSKSDEEKQALNRYLNCISEISKVFESPTEIMTDKESFVNQNMKEFWMRQGEKIVEQYSNDLILPLGNILCEDKLAEKLSNCEIFVITANSIEHAIVTRGLMKSCGVLKPDRIVADSQIYQFFRLKGHEIGHILPQRTGSFSENGSAKALSAAFKYKFPKAVYSIGVAYGKTPKTKNNNGGQEIGDVLISERLICWDAFNKLTDGKMTLNDRDFPYIGKEILAGCRDYLKNHNYPKSVQAGIGQFRWFLGIMLSGPTVLSDASFKRTLLNATQKYGIEDSIVGGEMEGSGIWYACKENNIPMLIIKGICDWGEDKNGWDFVEKDKEGKDLIKDSVQAFACENALKTFEFIVSQLYGQR